jgi:hypothetical protein
VTHDFLRILIDVFFCNGRLGHASLAT